MRAAVGCSLFAFRKTALAASSDRTAMSLTIAEPEQRPANRE
jgi:hypothetical protein